MTHLQTSTANQGLVLTEAWRRQYPISQNPSFHVAELERDEAQS
jgi:hypothetical protein